MVLLENTPFVKFVRNYIPDPDGIFSIFSQVKILMTSLPAFSWLLVCKQSLCLVKRNLHSGLKFIFSHSHEISSIYDLKFEQCKYSIKFKNYF